MLSEKLIAMSSDVLPILNTHKTPFRGFVMGGIGQKYSSVSAQSIQASKVLYFQVILKRNIKAKITPNIL